MSAEDDEALTWGGASDPSHVTGAVKKTPKLDVAPPSVEKSGPSSFLLISYGILAGMYLLYTVGWLVIVLNGKLDIPQHDQLHRIMYSVGECLAIASPAVWLVTVLILTRKRKPLVRLLLLVLGVFLLIPWPFVLLGA